MRQRFRWPLGYKPVDRWFRSPPVFTCSDISSLLFGKQPTTELGVWWPANSFGGPAVSGAALDVAQLIPHVGWKIVH